MAAPKGNKFWQVRSSHGRNPIFADADQFMAASLEYFQWVDANPLWESKAFASGGTVVVKKLPKMRAMTITGLCIFLDIAKSTFDDYRTREGFSAVVTRVEEIIYSQKFEGAAAELLNANIIARDLGLRDKTDLDLKGQVALTPIITFNGKGS